MEWMVMCCYEDVYPETVKKELDEIMKRIRGETG
jgi:hypothetical protein